jgi:CDP-diacylglycerol--serine O-phosphatidyltransferase
VVLIYTLGVAMLMVSQLPTWSSKLIGRRIRRDLVLPLFVLVVLVVALLLSFPWQTMTVLSLVYIASLPLSWRAYQRRLAADAAAPKDVDMPSTPPPGDAAPDDPRT